MRLCLSQIRGMSVAPLSARFVLLINTVPCKLWELTRLFVLTMHYMQLQVPSVVCPSQSVQVVTGCYLSDGYLLTKHLPSISELEIYDDKFIAIEVTELPVGKLCYYNMSLFSKDGVFVSGTSLNFSKLFLKN